MLSVQRRINYASDKHRYGNAQSDVGCDLDYFKLFEIVFALLYVDKSERAYLEQYRGYQRVKPEHGKNQS